MVKFVVFVLFLIAGFCYLMYEVWRSPAPTPTRVAYTIAGLFCTIPTLLVWIGWSRSKYGVD